jgi:hypothetical protein
MAARELSCFRTRAQLAFHCPVVRLSGVEHKRSTSLLDYRLFAQLSFRDRENEIGPIGISLRIFGFPPLLGVNGSLKFTSSRAVAGPPAVITGGQS